MRSVFVIGSQLVHTTRPLVEIHKHFEAYDCLAHKNYQFANWELLEEGAAPINEEKHKGCVWARGCDGEHCEIGIVEAHQIVLIRVCHCLVRLILDEGVSCELKEVRPVIQEEEHDENHLELRVNLRQDQVHHWHLRPVADHV